MTGKTRWKSIQSSALVAVLATLALSVDGYAEGKNFNGYKHMQRMRRMDASREKALAQFSPMTSSSSKNFMGTQALNTNTNLQSVTPKSTVGRTLGATSKFGTSVQTRSNLTQSPAFNRTPKSNLGAGFDLGSRIPPNKGQLTGIGVTTKPKGGSFGAFDRIATDKLTPAIGKGPKLGLDPGKIADKGGSIGEAGKLPVDKIPLEPDDALPGLPEKAPDPGMGGGADPGAPADPVLEEAPHDHDHGHCHWDVHFCHPHFHSHCWNPTLGCYQVWIYRNDVWVYETVYNLDVLSTQVTLANIALSEPVPYEFVEKLEDGTLIDRLGTYWTNPNGETSGREEWRMLDLGPAIEDQLTSAGALLKTPLGFEGTNQPAEFQSTEQQEDGTTMNRAGSWWVEPNGEPRGLDNWNIVAMGPVISVHIQNKVAPYVE
jgi:hypothetical protein